MRISFTRHNPTASFAYDQVVLEADMEDFEAMPLALTNLIGVADMIMPAAEDTQRALPAAQPVQQLAPAPAPQAWSPQPMAAGPTSWQSAETMISPCGESKGMPLAACTDEDLQYLATRYKKDAALKTAAAVVIAARRSGQTAQHW